MEDHVLPGLELAKHLGDRSCVWVALLVSIFARLRSGKEMPTWSSQSDDAVNLMSILEKVEGSVLPSFEAEEDSDFLFPGRGGVGGMRATQAPPPPPPPPRSFAQARCCLHRVRFFCGQWGVDERGRAD